MQYERARALTEELVSSDHALLKDDAKSYKNKFARRM